MNETCDRCRHWRSADGLLGKCHEGPPQLMPPFGAEDRRSDLQRTRWPLTQAADGCGRFQHKGYTSGE